MVLAHALQVDVVAHLVLEARHVQADVVGELGQRFRRQVLPVAKQHAVHFPELALRGGRLGRFGRQLRMRVRGRVGEMAVDETQARAVGIDQVTRQRFGLCAVRAFEVAVFDQRDGGIDIARLVLARGQAGSAVCSFGIHGILLWPHTAACL